MFLFADGLAPLESYGSEILSGNFVFSWECASHPTGQIGASTMQNLFCSRTKDAAHGRENDSSRRLVLLESNILFDSGHVE